MSNDKRKIKVLLFEDISMHPKHVQAFLRSFNDRIVSDADYYLDEGPLYDEMIDYARALVSIDRMKLPRVSENTRLHVWSAFLYGIARNGRVPRSFFNGQRQKDFVWDYAQKRIKLPEGHPNHLRFSSPQCSAIRMGLRDNHPSWLDPSSLEGLVARMGLSANHSRYIDPESVTGINIRLDLPEDHPMHVGAFTELTMTEFDNLHLSKIEFELL